MCSSDLPLEPERPDGAVDCLKAASHILGETPTGVGQDDITGFAAEHGGSQRGLQLFDSMADGRLTDAQVAAGASKRASGDDCEEDPQPAIRHLGPGRIPIDHIDASMTKTAN